MGRVGAVALMVGLTGVFGAPMSATAVSPASCTGHGPFTAGMTNVSCVIDPGQTGDPCCGGRCARRANEVRTVVAFIAPHGRSKIKVIDKTGVEAKRKFFRPRQ
jgi:hypothetical protein